MSTVRQVQCVVLCVWSLLVVSAASARAESELEKALRQYNFESVKGYIQPIADLFGANMNSGYYQSAAIPSTGLHVSLKIIAMGSLVTDDQKSYTVKLPAGFAVAPGASLKTATVFGGQGTLFRDAVNGLPTGLEYRGSDGILNTSIFPLGVPQLTIGSVYGTEVIVRFIAVPEIGDGKFPSTTLYAFGGRHSVSQYIPNAPLDIAAGIFYGKFKTGDIIDASSLSFGLQASKQLSVLVLYGGIQSEKSTMNLKFTSTDLSQPTPLVDIDLDGANTFRGTLGIGLALGAFNIFADANFGSVTALSGGIGFSF